MFPWLSHGLYISYSPSKLEEKLLGIDITER
jgi:hypothetical protein